jgi:hypothetical protein
MSCTTVLAPSALEVVDFCAHELDLADDHPGSAC